MVGTTSIPAVLDSDQDLRIQRREVGNHLSPRTLTSEERIIIQTDLNACALRLTTP